MRTLGDECVACGEEIKDRREHEKECSELCGDLMRCRNCGLLFDSGFGGYYVDDEDVGKDAGGSTAEIFRNDVEKSGNEWTGFKEEDIGPWCDSCSWTVQRKRERVSGANAGGSDE
ncbi:hypothetical protein [Halorarum salinum]|uniref:Uncharacterized protein n=1 Tax=Halorarum salinum TaxID=2743089 RepID=A0A7D5LAA0_9EURY|nr:hypothetical protein [Halobaculum salinum]QLG62026.1 hypothetical protein HUG12_09935 [Halobaculum salinum]